jgi:phage recombination protein Bet
MTQKTQGAEASATTAIAIRPLLTSQMAAQYGVEPAKFLQTLKATVMPKRQGGEAVQVSDEDLMAFCMVAHEYGLNPFLKEIHAFPNKSGGITPMVGVDGWAKLMNRKPEFDGIEFEATDDAESGKPHSVTARIYIKGRSRAVSVTEYYSECQRGTEPWRQMPRRMLRHKALIQAVRVAFGFAGIHDEEEALDIAEATPRAPRNVTPKQPLFKAPVPAQQVQDTPQVEPAQEEPKGAADAMPAPPEAAQPSTQPAPATELDAKRKKIEGAFIAAGLNFDDLVAFLASRGQDVAETSFGELSEPVVNRLIRALDSFVKQAKQLKEGGAQ